MNAADGDLLDLVREEFRRLIDVASQPLLSTIYRWPNSMPQYVVGHKDRQRAIANCLDELAGLHLVGNSYAGVGVPDCVGLAKAVADRIAL